ncbi:hypothetical protein TRVL_08309 [Trypanosoma vivax]|nr:hypothetical protein TRVL_08309 [Trypanosoma vivax]
MLSQWLDCKRLVQLSEPQPPQQMSLKIVLLYSSNLKHCHGPRLQLCTGQTKQFSRLFRCTPFYTRHQQQDHCMFPNSPMHVQANCKPKQPTGGQWNTSVSFPTLGTFLR